MATSARPLAIVTGASTGLDMNWLYAVPGMVMICWSPPMRAR
jgi:hypothetical protein